MCLIHDFFAESTTFLCCKKRFFKSLDDIKYNKSIQSKAFSNEFKSK